MKTPRAAALLFTSFWVGCSATPSGEGGAGAGSSRAASGGHDGSGGHGESNGAGSTAANGGMSASTSNSVASSTTSGSGGSSGGAGGSAPGCGEFTADAEPTCSKDGNSLGDCNGDVAEVTPCPNGCLREPTPQASICMGTTATNFSCTGSYGTTPVDDGNYYLTQFGCYVDTSGHVQTDPDDNCIPACLSQAIAAGLCPAGSSGPACEEMVNWYTADGARFGCLARLRVTNPTNGKSVIAVALDFGPGCSGENRVSHAVLDASGRVDDYLFGGPEGSSDKALVHVVQVDDSTPLGPM